MQQEPQRRRLVWCPEDGFSMSDLLHDSIDLFRPAGWFRILFFDPDKIFDCRDAAENPATNAFPRDLSEPTLHQVQPRRASGIRFTLIVWKMPG